MLWQDVVLTGANIVFVVSLLPQVINGFKNKKGFISLWTSGPTTVALFTVSYTVYTLQLYFSASITVVSGLLWLMIFIQKLVYKNE
jgi:hypothetical protein